MRNLKLTIEKIKCLKTSIEIGKDEIYCGGIFIPVKKLDNDIEKAKPVSFATEHVSMEKLKEVTKFDISNSTIPLVIPDGYDDYILILQLMEKDDGEIQNMFKNGDVAKAFENVNIWDKIKEKLLKSLNVTDLLSITSSNIWAILGKLVVKILPALIGGIVNQIKMDDIISTKQFSKEKADELNLSSPTEFSFSKMLAKYKVYISINEN